MSSLGRIAGYDLRELLGSSGLTETYRARAPHTASVRSVALKLLRLDWLPEEAREAAAVKFLAAGHRALAATVGGMGRIVEVSDDPAQPFVATELVPGVDMQGLVQLARRRDETAVGLAAPLVEALCGQVARILTSAHEANPPLPHLGLRPSSVRVTPAAGVVVVDFGVAASLRGLGEQRISSWYFLPPELLVAEEPSAGAHAGQTADLYSLGALLFFLLSGRPPLEASTLAQLVEQAWEPLPALPSMPEHLTGAMRRLMAPDPGKRPASAREAAELLTSGTLSAQERRDIIAGAVRALGITARPKKTTGPAAAPAAVPPPPFAKPAPAKRSARRSQWRWRLSLAGVTLVGLAAGFGGLWAYRARVPVDFVEKESAPGARVESAQPLNTMEIPPTSELGARTNLDADVPSDRVYVPAPKRKLPRVPGHLDIDTVPTGADVWVDGVLRGTTPVDLTLGPGGHRVVLLKEGFRMHKDVYDTTDGEWIRPHLRAVVEPPSSGAFVNVYCRGTSRLPIFVDEEDTGHLCPVKMLPVLPGQRKIAVFVPARRDFVSNEVLVRSGPKPQSVTLQD
ncbi:MAG: PEGA domain-containing protein [Deltaproteobacteria bacterium]|nr:PEGA domain-containing protein [Deltaproteobacteria bacterium]